MNYFAAIIVVLLDCQAAAQTPVFQDARCEGVYPSHLQGICTNSKDALYWSWTNFLVKTNAKGGLEKKVPVASHHGDLCFHEGKVYVAVNLGKFNAPAGKADSWVYVYDGETLEEISRHPVPELVHGAGGMGCDQGHFMIAGGLPPGAPDNLVYEYDEAFSFKKRHTLASGYTYKGIQTVSFAKGDWWFGCYGSPRYLLRADAGMHFRAKRELDAAFGLVGLPDGRFLLGGNQSADGGGNVGTVRVIDL